MHSRLATMIHVTDEMMKRELNDTGKEENVILIQFEKWMEDDED